MGRAWTRALGRPWWPEGRAFRLPGVLALVLLAFVFLAESLPRSKANGSLEVKLRAARRMEAAMAAIREGKRRLGIPVPLDLDPNGTGLIGPEESPLTTTHGSLSAKRTSTNPNFAALMVHLYREAGLRRGEQVALGLSGSFPALNIAALVAAEELGLVRLAISSVGASSYGATDPTMTWLDMEGLLFQAGLIGRRSLAAGYGGIIRWPGLFPEDPVALAQRAIERNGLVPLQEEGPLEESISARMALYRRAAGGRPISAFVNVGGAAENLGVCVEAGRLPPGLLRPPPLCFRRARGVLFRMAEEGVAVIHLLNVHSLARRYGLSIDPVPLPSVGEGAVYGLR